MSYTTSRDATSVGVNDLPAQTCGVPSEAQTRFGIAP